MKPQKVLIATPYTDRIEPEHGDACMMSMQREMDEHGDKYEIVARRKSNTATPHCFNILWCDALNEGFDWFMMVHADIAPCEPGWLGTMLTLAQDRRVEVLHTVNAIKDGRGAKSLAVGSEGDPWGVRRLITGTEIKRLPSMFAMDALLNTLDGPWPERPCLLPNTGCLLIQITPRMREFPGFEFRTRLRTTPEGKRYAQFLPEDWLLGHWLAEKGIEHFGTRLVTTQHFGRGAWHSECEGTDKTDPMFQAWAEAQGLKVSVPA